MITSYMCGVLVIIAVVILFSVMGHKKDPYDEASWFFGSLKGFGVALLMSIIASCFNTSAFGFGCLVATGVVFVFEISVFLLMMAGVTSPVVLFFLLVGMIFMLIAGGSYTKKQANIVMLPEQIVETRYEILDSSDSSRKISDKQYLMMDGIATDGKHYILYRFEEHNGQIVMVPVKLPEDKTTVIVSQEEAYLVKVDKVYYKEDKNHTPSTINIDHIETTYMIYANVSMIVGGVINSK